MVPPRGIARVYELAMAAGGSQYRKTGPLLFSCLSRPVEESQRGHQKVRFWALTLPEIRQKLVNIWLVKSRFGAEQKRAERRVGSITRGDAHATYHSRDRGSTSASDCCICHRHQSRFSRRDRPIKS